MKCRICFKEIEQDLTGEPYLEFKGAVICYECYIGLIPVIYSMSGAGDGGIIHYAFLGLLGGSHNKKKRMSLKSNKALFDKVMLKYKMSCVHCGEKDTNKLTLDHIKPFSKGGLDEITNLQILCKSCNSKKGAKYEK